MGATFSNIHIKKNDTLQQKDIQDYCVQMMKEKGYELVPSSEDAEGILCIYSPADSKWISVFSDLVDLDQVRQFRETALPLSKAMETDVLAISCYDSDFLFMNLVNAGEKIDAWANIGRLYAPPERKTNFSAWERKVSNIFAFQKTVKGEHTFVEDALYELEELLELSGVQACISDISADEILYGENILRLYFAMPDDGKKEPPQLAQHHSSLLPCKEESNLILACNKGGASTGVAVAFMGDYVEQEEITFSDVYFEWEIDGRKRKSQPVTLTKCKNSKGEWMYYWEDKNFSIPPKVNPNLPIMKLGDMESKRSFGVRFTPHGNKRKFIDIRVHLIPLAHPQGQYCWYVWEDYPSKAAYIEDYNAMMDKMDIGAVVDLEKVGLKLNPEDYDL